jgi:hypothetical protein
MQEENKGGKCPLPSCECGRHPLSLGARDLNNYLQVNGGKDRLTWEVSKTGPDHKPLWTAIAYGGQFCSKFLPCVPLILLAVDQTEYARGEAGKLSVAKNIASRTTLQMLLDARSQTP